MVVIDEHQLGGRTFCVSTLCRSFPPVLKHVNKARLFDAVAALAPAPSGQLIVHRWKASPLPTAMPDHRVEVR